MSLEIKSITSSNSSRNIFIIAITILTILTFLVSYSNITLLVRIKDRILYGEYMVKAQHTIDYWSQVKNGFWIYPKAEFSLKENNWFHNFFFDVHRTSGPVTAIIAYTIFLLTFGLSVINVFRKTYYAKELLVLYVSFFPYLYTSIPWESSENQMTTFYAGITAMILKDRKKVVKID
jgi:hypothetical protein